jgi:hypothetical protein
MTLWDAIVEERLAEAQRSSAFDDNRSHLCWHRAPKRAR